jgi:Bacterial extracellular solute-binding proteins, family 5 Middle
MARATDEPDALYGLAARAVRISPDGLTYRFLMRPGITFHDGSPLTAHDVAFSLKVLKEKGHPIAQQLLRDLVDAEASDDATMVGRFAPNRAREGAEGRPARAMDPRATSCRMSLSSRETDCVAGHVGLELRNVAANYPFERPHRFPGTKPNSGHRDYSR